MVLFETRGLRLSSVIRGGIKCQWRLCAEARDRLTWEWILTLEPRAPETSLATTKRRIACMVDLFSGRSSLQL